VNTRNVTLGKYLKTIRIDRNLSLKQLEEASERQISATYLSYVENNKIRTPSPDRLLLLSKIYNINSARLLEMAGHVHFRDCEDCKMDRPPSGPFAEMNLTAEEETKLLEYLEFLRWKPAGPR
jgi:transcriptional regulator with XRE-family HTH domain